MGEKVGLTPKGRLIPSSSGASGTGCFLRQRSITQSGKKQHIVLRSVAVHIRHLREKLEINPEQLVI